MASLATIYLLPWSVNTTLKADASLIRTQDTIGITGTLPQLGINLGNTAIYFVFTLFGAYIIDIFRRRTLIFVGITLIVSQAS